EQERRKVGSLIPGEEPGEETKYLSAVFSDLGVVPEVEEQQPEASEIEGSPVEGVVADAPTLVLPNGRLNGERNGNGAGEHSGRPHRDPAIAITPDPVRPFFEDLLAAETAGKAAEGSGGRRWRVAALSFVGFVAVAGTAAAMLSLGYQQNSQRSEVARTGADVRRQLTPEIGVTETVTASAEGFPRCTTGKGLSPVALMVVARHFGATAPAVCLPTEKARKKPPSKAATTGTALTAEQITTAPIIGTAPAGGSPSSGGSRPAPGGGSGSDPATGTGGGGGEPGPAPSPTPTSSPTPPPDEGTTEPRPGNGWGQGGKPKGDG
ncbi:MAG: hypothetical protein M3N24_01465, partial [Actinomycetota bacterium]|nr:hypothetical protein [Actinomycetota bacterium]